MAQVETTRLTKVGNRQQFMDSLDDMASSAIHDGNDQLSAGRPRELKTYILESNEPFKSFETDDLSCTVIDTDLSDIKIFRVVQKSDQTVREFYLDTADDRLLLLHTNEESHHTHKIIRKLAMDHNHKFDHAWLYSDMLKKLAHMRGNTFKGFGVNYHMQTDDGTEPIEGLAVSVSGSVADRMEELMKTDEHIRRRTAFNKIRIGRGTDTIDNRFAHDDVEHTGYIALKKGKSVSNHMDIVNFTKNEYKKSVTLVEDQRICPKKVGNGIRIEGNAFNFTFKHRIEDLSLFIKQVFNSTEPFRLWGLKSKIDDGYFFVHAVDLHTGAPMDFEIADDMIRVYLFDGCCGNTLLRLLTNLQQYYDSSTVCSQLM